MARVNMKSIDANAKMKYLDLLWTSIAQLESKEETKHFFKDLLSESEAIMLARRIEIAKRLLQGESYDNIIKELRVGKDTVGRVQRWLVSGFGGYEKAIKGFENETQKRFKTIKPCEDSEPYSFGWIRKKYPLHFLLFNLLKDMKGKK